MDLALRLFGRGLFPKELPHSFSSSRAATTLQRIISSTLFPVASRSSDFLRHSLARAGGIRRTLGIPNPVSYFELCREIAKHWAILSKTCRGSKWSLSRPRHRKADGRSVGPLVSLGELNEGRARARLLGRYLLRVDVNECYRSVYTHSIPWALHTKTVAKVSRGKANLPGEALDKAVRRCQFDETMGLPIGPDASFILAEALLSAVDSEACGRIKPQGAIRYYDDYEMTFSSRREAEAALAIIQEVLGGYNLLVNVSKTEIVELPKAIDSQWAADLSHFDLSPGPAFTQRIVRFFDTVAGYRATTRDSQVVGYAISRFEDAKTLRAVDQKSWGLIEGLLLHFAVNEPSAIVQVLRLLANVHLGSYSFDIDVKKVGQILNEIVCEGAPLGHSSEVAWAIWGLIAFGQILTEVAAESCSQMTDSVVALLALDAEARRLVPSRINKSLWESYVNPKALYESQWLLAYEGPMQGWIGATSHLNADPNFNLLAQNNVHFYTKFKRLNRRVVDELDLWSSGYDDVSFDDDEDEDDQEADDEDLEGAKG